MLFFLYKVSVDASVLQIKVCTSLTFVSEKC